MAEFGYTFETQSLPDAQDFSPLPAGPYDVMIVNTKLLPTNKTKELMTASGFTDASETGFAAFRKTNANAEGFLSVEMDVQGPTNAGRKLFHNLNLLNENPKASEMAAGQLKQILTALGMARMTKSEEMHNKRLSVVLDVKPGNTDAKTGKMYPPQNQVKKFQAIGSAVAGTPPVAAVAGNTPPWKK